MIRDTKGNRTIRIVMGWEWEFSRCMNFFRPAQEYFLVLLGVYDLFFFIDFPLQERLLCTSPSHPITFQMVRPLIGVKACQFSFY